MHCSCGCHNHCPQEEGLCAQSDCGTLQQGMGSKAPGLVGLLAWDCVGIGMCTCTLDGQPCLC